jgi:endonuclease/exonuclease/phosphatase family metal-dependent hydrolase
MDILLRAGLKDSCIYYCQMKTRETSKTITEAWSMSGKDKYSQCIQDNCPATEPTNYSTEWPNLPNNEKHPFVRLDFILVSSALLTRRHRPLQDTVKAYVDVTNRTKLMSDHFPMALEWFYDEDFDLF